MIDSGLEWNRGWHSAAPALKKKKADAALSCPQLPNDFSRSLTRRAGPGRWAGGQAGGRRQGREGRSILRCISPSLLHSSTTLPSPLYYSLHPQTSPDITIHGSARVSINILTSTSSPCCRRTSFSSTPRTGVISCQLVPISECECDKASQDLAGEQNRVVAHASYLLSFKPLHTISSAQDQLRRPLQRADYSLDSIQPGAGASSPVLLEARPSRPHQSDSLPHTLTTRTTPALHSPSLLLDRRLRPVSVEPLHCDPLSSSKYPPRPVVAPPHKRSTGTSTHLSTEPRETATLLPPWNTGRSCIASGNVALWCEEFCLPIGMPGPVLQNLVISKPKVSLRILNDNHGHRPALT